LPQANTLSSQKSAACVPGLIASYSSIICRQKVSPHQSGLDAAYMLGLVAFRTH
jgi:hypothetical protein